MPGRTPTCPPTSDTPSLRDYSIPAWRNLRRFPTGGTWWEITDVVRDSVAIRRSNDAWAPLNVAYVDERRELFTFAPERVLLAAREAADLRAAGDTTIGGTVHARVSATVDRFPTTLFFRRTDGLLAMARYQAAQPNDFGLTLWGRMEVELWYSRWAAGPLGVNLPMQWDVRRVGRPYRRVTVLSMALDSSATADSFTVSDSLRTAFLATANRPMYDVPLDSARMVQPRLARLPGFGYPTGAVKLGDRWLLLETGQAPLNAQRAVEWLGRADQQAGVGGAVLTFPAAVNGGVVWLVQRGTQLHVGPGAAPFIATILGHSGASLPRGAEVAKGRWLRMGADSAWVEPIDLPDAAGSLLVYVPSLRWAYSAVATGPLQQQYVVERIREHGWEIERIGSLRELWAAVPQGNS